MSEQEGGKGSNVFASQVHILVVDDDQPMRDAVSIILESMGHTVSLVINGREAVDWCREQTFDAVLMDIHMPLMRGDEACRKIKEEGNCDCVILMSGQPFSKEQVAQCGATGFIEKPVSIDNIVEHIDACLERASK